MDKFSNALVFATEKHAGQTRKGGVTPYIMHPIEVALMVKAAGYSIECQIVALLHDTMEDCGVQKKDLSVFGDDIVEAVALLSKNYKPTSSKKYVERILNNDYAAIVKNYDRLANLREAKETMDKEFIDKYVKNSYDYYGKFSKVLDSEIEGCSIGQIKNSRDFWLYKDETKRIYEATKYR